MSQTALSKTLSLLPRRGITGIGSLPHTQAELALQMALQADLPYLPQLPAGHPSELMIAAALEGLPGAVADDEGMVTVDVAAWEQGRAALEERLEVALARTEDVRFEPTPAACRAWQPFRWEVENRKLAFAKVHIAGPCTVRWVARTSSGAPLSDVPALEQQAFRLVWAKALAMVRALRRANATPILYLDEPGLYALDAANPRHLLALQELKLLVTSLQREGALVGLHSCSNVDWARLMSGLGLNLMSLDVRLSLDALLEDRAVFERYLDGGGALSLGVVPTNRAGETYDVRELVDAVTDSIRSAVDGPRATHALTHCLLTPACGLALRTVPDAEAIFAQVREAQRLLETAA